MSVVLPCRNSARWLPATLESLLQQRGVDYELIVVDDGSTDHSLDLIKTRWQASRMPMRVLHGNGLGVSAARNLGWRAAAYSVVAFLDADDIARPLRLSHQAQLFERDSRLQQVLCGWCRIDESDTPLVEVRPWEEGAGFGFLDALRHKAVLPSAWMLRREALEAVAGFDETLTQAEDVDLLLRLARIGAKGAWLQEVLCDYRIHSDGASQRARDQARGLTYVVERHLRWLPPSSDNQRLLSEVRYGTRAWLGWYSWSTGDPDLAHELWSTTLGLSPFPPGLTWVHLAENVVRSAKRIGVPSEIDSLFESTLWRQLEQRWLAARNSPILLSSSSCSVQLDWSLVYRGQWRAALLAWARQLRSELEPDGAPIGESGLSYWHPVEMRRRLDSKDSLAKMRECVLVWAESLLRLNSADPDSSDMEVLLKELQIGLARILAMWTQIVWAEDRRPALQRLEQWVALMPCQQSLNALARVHQKHSEAGARALRLLARSCPDVQADHLDTLTRDTNLHLPSLPAFWEYVEHAEDQCTGPQCSSCIGTYLQNWKRRGFDSGLIEWSYQASSSDDVFSNDCLDIQILPMGEAWLRPPGHNPWNATHGYAVAEASGRVLRDFSRRYPLGWPNACQHPDQAPEPRPSGECTFIDGTVIALIGLSAETYYHWLLEVLPRLQDIEEAGINPAAPSIRIWHNGGDHGYVYDTLLAFAGIPRQHCLDARSMSWIRARRLVVIRPPAFGVPSVRSQDWLRRRSLGDSSDCLSSKQSKSMLWLWRGTTGRRPVIGEAEVLDRLKCYQPRVLDPKHLTVREQAQLISSASLIIAPHGGAMTNLVFASSGAKVLELHNESYSPPYFHALVGARGLCLYSQAQPSKIPSLYRDLFFESAATEPIVLSPDLIEAAVEQIF